MNLQSKWSGELANGQWSSLEIGLDESDVVRWSYEYEWEYTEIPVRLLYMFMEAELQMLMSATLLSRYPDAVATSRDDLVAWTQKRAEAKRKIDDFFAK